MAGTWQTMHNEFGDILIDFNNPRAGVTPNTERIVRARTRQKNKKEWTFNMRLLGDTRLRAGNTIELTDWGVFDGKYIIEKAEHTVSGSGGYTTGIEARRVLEGY